MLLKQVNQDGGRSDMFFNFDFYDDNLFNVGAGDLQFGVRKELKRAVRYVYPLVLWVSV